MGDGGLAKWDFITVSPWGLPFPWQGSELPGAAAGWGGGPPGRPLLGSGPPRDAPGQNRGDLQHGLACGGWLGRASQALLAPLPRAWAARPSTALLPPAPLHVSVRTNARLQQ